LEYARSQISEDYFGIFLFGSQNFGFGSEDSDVDTRYVYFSDKSEVGDYSELIPFEKEYIEAIEVRQFFLSFDNGSLSVIECLLTDFYIINPVYS
jgi:predicted nucleotidyltransferase